MEAERKAFLLQLPLSGPPSEGAVHSEAVFPTLMKATLYGMVSFGILTQTGDTGGERALAEELPPLDWLVSTSVGAFS